VRRPLHEARLARNPAEREADLIDEANTAHTADATRPKPHSTQNTRVRRWAWNWKISIVALALAVAFLVVALVARFH
jgi:hypothetical protein